MAPTNQSTQRTQEKAGLIQEVSSALWAFGPTQRAVTYTQNWAWPNLMIGLPALQALYLNKWIEYDEYKQCAILLGADPKGEGRFGYTYPIVGGTVLLGDRVNAGNTQASFQKQLWDSSWIPSLGMAIELFRRGLVDASFLQHCYERNGITHPSFAALINQTIYEVPSASEAIRLAARGHFDAARRNRLGLDDEYDDSATWSLLLKASGAGNVNIVDGAGVTRTVDIARELWANHWTLPGFADAREFLFRLRPQDADASTASEQAAGTFDRTDWNDLLHAAGYNDVQRKRLFAIMWKLPERRMLLSMAKAGTIDQKTISEIIRKQGYDDKYSGQVADAIWRSRLKQLGLNETRILIDNGVIPPTEASNAIVALGYSGDTADHILSVPRKQISESMILQMVTRRIMKPDEAILRLRRDGYGESDASLLVNYAAFDRAYGDGKQAISSIKQAYETGVIDRDQAIGRLVKRGDTEAEANLALDFIDLQVSLDHYKKVIAVLKKLYITGYNNENETRLQLNKLGVTDAAKERLISEWSLAITPRRRELSAQQDVTSFKRGLLSVDGLVARLNALGYASDDQALLSLAALQDVAKSNAAAALKASRSVAAQQKAAAAQLKALNNEQKQAQKDLARHGTPQQIAKWFKQKLITQGVALARLRALNWPQNDALLLLESATAPTSKNATASKSNKG